MANLKEVIHDAIHIARKGKTVEDANEIQGLALMTSEE